jgi:hypothetical protein
MSGVLADFCAGIRGFFLGGFSAKIVVLAGGAVACRWSWVSGGRFGA